MKLKQIFLETYELSFSPEFFYAEGEPYDRSDLALNSDGNPVSVWSALQMMDDKTWNDMAQEVFGVEGEFLTPETVMDKIQETNTVGDLTPPVDVWIDENGDYTVDVWDEDRGY